MGLGFWDWGLGIGDWGLDEGANGRRGEGADFRCWNLRPGILIKGYTIVLHNIKYDHQ